jgi:type VI secretion system ImpC/EvpB family protein
MPERSQYTTYQVERTEPLEQAVPSQQTAEASPLEQVVEDSLYTEAYSAGPSSNPGLADFIDGKLSVAQSLNVWFGDVKSQVDQLGLQEWKRSSMFRISRDLAEIDHLVNEQLNAILHHPRFQALEASWRGLEMLVEANVREGTNQIRTRFLNISWREIHRDFQRANDFDNSQIFRKVYEDEFGTPGGIPFSVLIGDYEIHPRPTPEHPFDDIAILGHIAGVAAAAFCPFVCGAAPAMFGVDNFLELQQTVDLGQGFQLPEFTKWRTLRKHDDARFLGIAMPRILMRAPYELKDTPGLNFTETTVADHLGKYLWGNAAYAWATVLMRTFATSGWLADIRGVERNRDGGGLVTNLASISFRTDRKGVALRSSTDLMITDQQESGLAKLGFLPICKCYDTEYSAFYSSQSIQEPMSYDTAVSTANANISTMMQYMLCVSRFAHYLKVIARDIVGSAIKPDELQTILDRWIKDYVTPDDHARPEIKAKRPLRQADITVSQDPGKSGSYQCTFSLLPHYQLDDLSAAIRLRTTTKKRES